LVYFGFPADFWVLIGEIAHRPFARPTAVAPLPASFPGPSMPGTVQSGHPVFRRIACRPIFPAAAVPVVCPSAGSIGFAPADFARTAVVASDSVLNSVAIAIAIAGFAGTAAGSVV